MRARACVCVCFGSFRGGLVVSLLFHSLLPRGAFHFRQLRLVATPASDYSPLLAANPNLARLEIKVGIKGFRAIGCGTVPLPPFAVVIDMFCVAPCAPVCAPYHSHVATFPSFIAIHHC